MNISWHDKLLSVLQQQKDLFLWIMRVLLNKNAPHGVDVILATRLSGTEIMGVIK